jgi:hypothetical protein
MDDIIELNDLGGDMSFKKSTNFGGGIELLMNDRVKDSSKKSSDIGLDDLTSLENELNELSDMSFKPKSDVFNGKISFDDKPSVSFSDNHSSSDGRSGYSQSPSIGQSTAGTSDDTKTWDGYGKFNNIPANPDSEFTQQMSREELLREKFKLIRKLEALEKKGIELSKKYTMESPLMEMQGEYETIMEEKSKQNAVKFQGNMLMAVINGIEFLNGRFDPFDIKLDGWSEQINENITDYDDIFGELHEKYKSKATMAPELKLLFQLGGSAMMVHMTNTMFKSAMPGMDDILRQNPDLMRSFQTAAVNSMSQSSPNLSGFMSNMMNEGSSGAGPPPPMATQTQQNTRNRPGNNSYGMDDGIKLNEMHDKTRRPPPRAEMKGPSDISDILSGLKTKTINIQETQNNDSSTISINDLKELQGGGNLPKRTGRRKKSESNTISLDI